MALITPWAINADAGSPAMNAAAARRILGALLTPGPDALTPRTGALHPDALEVTLVGSDIHVATGPYVVGTPADGPYITGLDATHNGHTLQAADATDPRVDRVWLRIYDHDLDGSGMKEPAIEYTAGTAEPDPDPPAVPSMAEPLARIDVPAEGMGSPVVTDERTFTWPYTGPFRAPQVFTASGTWVNPQDGFKAIEVEVLGGGGGGAGAETTTDNSVWGRAGTSGVYARSVIPAASLGPTETVTVGDGGAGGVGQADGSPGGTSSFGGHVSADGGNPGELLAPGDSVVSFNGTARPTNGTGDLVVPGDSGSTRALRLSAFQGLSGVGGSSIYGSGGSQLASAGDGGAGLGFGAGGGGAADRGLSGPFTGGVGAPGLVIVKYIY